MKNIVIIIIVPRPVVVRKILLLLQCWRWKGEQKNLRLNCKRVTARASRDYAARLAQGVPPKDSMVWPLPLDPPLHLDLRRDALRPSERLKYKIPFDLCNSTTSASHPVPRFEPRDEYEEDVSGHGGRGLTLQVVLATRLCRVGGRLLGRRPGLRANLGLQGSFNKDVTKMQNKVVPEFRFASCAKKGVVENRLPIRDRCRRVMRCLQCIRELCRVTTCLEAFLEETYL